MSTALTERSGPGRPPTFPNPKLEEVFLDLLREGHSVSSACKALHISRPTVFGWKRDSEEFSAAWEDAMEASIDGLEDLARQRAKEGSDTMIIFLLKSRRRKIYGERV